MDIKRASPEVTGKFERRLAIRPRHQQALFLRSFHGNVIKRNHRRWEIGDSLRRSHQLHADAHDDIDRWAD